MAETAIIIVNGHRVKGLMVEGESVFSVQCDAVKSEEYEFTAEATDYPIESSANGSDHIMTRPDQVTFEGIVSNSPMVPLGGDKTSEIEVPKKSGKDQVKVTWSRPVDPNAVDRAQAAFDMLESLLKAKALLTVVLGLKVYRDMALIRVNVTRRSGEGSALKFSASLKQIVKSTVNIVQFYGPYLQDRAAPAVSRGTVTPIQEEGLNLPPLYQGTWNIGQ